MHRLGNEQLTPRSPLYQELGRLLARLGDDLEPDVRTDVADDALDLLAVLERLDGAAHVHHPRGMRVYRGGEAA